DVGTSFVERQIVRAGSAGAPTPALALLRRRRSDLAELASHFASRVRRRLGAGDGAGRLGAPAAAEPAGAEQADGKRRSAARAPPEHGTRAGLPEKLHA